MNTDREPCCDWPLPRAEEPVPVAEWPLWWLSFVDPDIAATIPREEQRPGGPSFLGATVVQAPDAQSAVRMAWALGTNPGGEVGIFGPLPVEAVGAEWRDRLLTAEDIEAMNVAADTFE